MPGPEERVIEQPPARAPGGPAASPMSRCADDSPGFRQPDGPAETQARRENLQERLERLPPGHPSSPFRDDGFRKPPPPDYRQHELPLPDDPDLPDHRPLTDKEYAEHVRQVRERLDQARANGLATNKQHTIDEDEEIWSEARDELHDEIIETLLGEAGDVPNDRQAIIAGGLPGSGKSTVLDMYAGIDRSTYLKIDPDRIKEEMAKRGMIPTVEGLSPMEASDLAHEESSYIAKLLAFRAQASGKNVIWDITMSKQSSVEERIDDLRAAGYNHIEGVFVDIPPGISEERAAARHRTGHDEYRAGEGYGGRFVPVELIRNRVDEVWGSVNRKNFEGVKAQLDGWAIYDNSVDGRAPVLVNSANVEKRQ